MTIDDRRRKEWATNNKQQSTKKEERERETSKEREERETATSKERERAQQEKIWDRATNKETRNRDGKWVSEWVSGWVTKRERERRVDMVRQWWWYDNDDDDDDDDDDDGDEMCVSVLRCTRCCECPPVTSLWPTSLHPPFFNSAATALYVLTLLLVPALPIPCTYVPVPSTRRQLKNKFNVLHDWYSLIQDSILIKETKQVLFIS